MENEAPRRHVSSYSDIPRNISLDSPQSYSPIEIALQVAQRCHNPEQEGFRELYGMSTKSIPGVKHTVKKFL